MLHPHDCVAAGLDAGGDWSIRFERHAGLKCNAVLHGDCRLRVDGLAETLHLRAGDCFILPHGRPFLISAHPSRSGEDAAALYAPVPHGGTATHGGGGEFFMTGSRFLLAGPAAHVLLGPLPPAIVLRDGAVETRPEREAVRWALERMAGELREPRPGGAVSIAHLAHFLLVQIMRCHLAEAPRGEGWLAALADPRLSAAVAAVHADPARAWTVRELAALARMSRTSFAVRFARVMGRSPIEYLTRWRMLVAADRLARTTAPVAGIAADVGYASESAFANAFKRVMGRTPRRYANERAMPLREGT